MECRVWQKLCQTGPFSYLTANVYCHCHDGGNTFQLENKSHPAAKGQTYSTRKKASAYCFVEQGTGVSIILIAALVKKKIL